MKCKTGPKEKPELEKKDSITIYVKKKIYQKISKENLRKELTEAVEGKYLF